MTSRIALDDANHEARGDDLTVVRLELRPDLVEAGPGEGVLDRDVGPEDRGDGVHTGHAAAGMADSYRLTVRVCKLPCVLSCVSGRFEMVLALVASWTR